MEMAEEAQRQADLAAWAGHLTTPASLPTKPAVEIKACAETQRVEEDTAALRHAGEPGPEATASAEEEADSVERPMAEMTEAEGDTSTAAPEDLGEAEDSSWHSQVGSVVPRGKSELGLAAVMLVAEHIASVVGAQETADDTGVLPFC